MTPEGKVQAHLRKRVKALGGETRKVKWEAHRGAPDILVMLPPTVATGWGGEDCLAPTVLLVEVKAPREKPEPHQVREHATLRKFGWRVEVVDSIERVEEVLR